jgi:hypothetical protein
MCAGWDWHFLDVDVEVSYMIAFYAATDKLVARGRTHPRAMVTQQQLGGEGGEGGGDV